MPLTALSYRHHCHFHVLMYHLIRANNRTASTCFISLILFFHSSSSFFFLLLFFLFRFTFSSPCTNCSPCVILLVVHAIRLLRLTLHPVNDDTALSPNYTLTLIRQRRDMAKQRTTFQSNFIILS